MVGSSFGGDPKARAIRASFPEVDGQENGGNQDKQNWKQVSPRCSRTCFSSLPEQGQLLPNLPSPEQHGPEMDNVQGLLRFPTHCEMPGRVCPVWAQGQSRSLHSRSRLTS